MYRSQQIRGCKFSCHRKVGVYSKWKPPDDGREHVKIFLAHPNTPNSPLFPCGKTGANPAAACLPGGSSSLFPGTLASMFIAS